MARRGGAAAAGGAVPRLELLAALVALLAVLGVHPCEAAVQGRNTPQRKAHRLMALQGPELFARNFGAAALAAGFPHRVQRYFTGRASARWDGVTCDAATAVYAVMLEISLFWALQAAAAKAGGALARMLFKHRWGASRSAQRAARSARRGMGRCVRAPAQHSLSGLPTRLPSPSSHPSCPPSLPPFPPAPGHTATSAMTATCAGTTAAGLASASSRACCAS